MEKEPKKEIISDRELGDLFLLLGIAYVVTLVISFFLPEKPASDAALIAAIVASF